MKNSIVYLCFAFLVLVPLSCKKDSNKPADANPELPTFVSGSGWTTESKFKADIQNLFLIGIENIGLVKYNDAFYWKIAVRENDPNFGNRVDFAYYKIQDSKASLFLPSAPNFNKKTDEFFFMENDASEQAAVLNNGFKLFKNTTPYFSGWDLLFWPNNITSDLYFAPQHKYSVCYNIANYSTVTTLNLETGKFNRYRNSGAIGFNHGSFAIDENYNTSYPNSFKAYHSSISYTGNYKMHLIVGEICDTIASKYGDPSSNSNSNEGYYILKNPIDTSYLCDLGGIGYNFGDGYTKSVDAGAKVYIFVSCKGMTQNFKLYSFDKATRKLTYLFTSNLISSATQLFFRKGKNDIILNSGMGLYRLDLNTMIFSSISPTTSANTAFTSLVTQPFSNGQYSDRIYAVVCALNGLTLTANLVYYE